MQGINRTLFKVTELLNDGLYHAGTTMGSQLGITRSAIWKALKKLENYGIPLKSVKGKGYLLTTPVTLLNVKKIKSYLKHNSIELKIFEKISSTNDYLKNFTNKNNKIRICIAETQTQGRGRLNRNWYSPFGQNIYFSMLYPFQKDLSELSGLSLVVALAICKAIMSMNSLNEDTLSVKWPNDILTNGCKIAGNLIEVQAESNGLCQAIIGIGINVNMEGANKNDVNQPWSSLLKFTGQYQDRNILSANLTDILIEYLEKFSSFGINFFLDDWKKKDILFNRDIALLSGKSKYEGICAGINEQGYLLLKTSGKKIQSYSSGDTTLL